jgi:hypothetical protein
LLTCKADGSSSCCTANCTAWHWYVQCFAIAVSYRVSALVLLPECIFFGGGNYISSRALIAILEKGASFAEHSEVTKGVDEALCAEKEGVDRARLGNALLQVAVNNSFNVPS